MAARPATSRSARPTTTSHPSIIDRDPQYTYSQEYSLEDQDDESDDEDVFAFHPPSTAQRSQPPSLPSPAQSPPLSQPPQVYFPNQPFPASVPSPTSPPPPFSPVADPLIYPPPTFDPHALERHIPQAGPSTTSVHFVGTVDSPPSSADRRDSHSSDDGFRLRKLGRLRTGFSTATDYTTSSSQYPLDDKPHSFLLQEKRHPSTALSDLSTVDPEFDGADSVSIKSVPLPTSLSHSY
jgi:hypothetical protein